MAIATQATRFALLKIDDDYSSDDESNQGKKGKSNTEQQSASSKKKKSRKNKKLNAGKSESEQLKNLAFGGGNKKSSGAKTTQPATNGRQSAQSKGEASDKQWEEWRRLDTDQAAESYEKDLQQALLLSKLEHEGNKGVADKPNSSARPDSSSSSSKQRKKGKKKDKPQAMSLEEFNQKPPEKESRHNSESNTDPLYEIMPAPSKPNTALPAHADPDPKFFRKVEKDAQKIIRKEHVQEEYRKQFAAEGAVVTQLRSELENRMQDIKQLQKENKGLTEELKQVKKRNQQLCHILSQGEMKDKAAVQIELEQIQSAHRELTDEVTQLTEELERERSRNGALKAENDKLKAGKHR